MHRSETVSIMVDSGKLRRIADEFDKAMDDRSTLPGNMLPSESFRMEGLEVKLVADQEWYDRRDEGIPDWDGMAPGPEALSRFALVKDEEREFPKTYSGQAWRAAYRIWSAVREKPSTLDGLDGFSDVPGADMSGLGLSGFMFGWALNSVRQMLGKSPGPNPAVLTIGVKDQTPQPAVGPAGGDLKQTLGG